MTQLAILGSSITVFITFQNWPPDTFGPFMSALSQRRFILAQTTTTQTLARKETTTNVGVDYPNRRITIQITNNITSPHENVVEIFSILSQIGYPRQEYTERIDINANVTIKLMDKQASSLVPNVVEEQFVKKTEEVFGRYIKTTGIRISSSEPLYSDVAQSPFTILIEPLFTDAADTKLFVQILYSTSNSDYTIDFLQHLYDRLKKVIMVFDNNE